MTSYARLRADIDIREFASFTSQVIERYPTNSLVEILDEDDKWLHIKPIRIDKAVSGYIPRLGLVFPDGGDKAVFPNIELNADGQGIPSIPPGLTLTEFLTWLDSNDAPPWIPAEAWGLVSKATETYIIDAIKAVIQNNLSAWLSWVNEITASNRLDEALMDEWIVHMTGGREIFTARNHYIYQHPDLKSATLGSVLKGQIMHWTGQVRNSTNNAITKSFYEVDFYRLSREMRGWFRSDLIAPYFFPTPENDPEFERNKINVFDLTTPILRHPQDSEFEAAKAAGYTGAQYLNIRNALGKSLVHFSLCGEICISALVGSDVIPLLKTWLESGYWRAKSILENPKEGTGAADLRSILQLFGRVSEMYNSIPMPAQFIKERLKRGEFAISGCGITASGRIKAESNIRHWVIVEDVLPVGNSGWVRVYNPFQNQEEVYEYNMFMASTGTGTGLWIKP